MIVIDKGKADARQMALQIQQKCRLCVQIEDNKDEVVHCCGGYRMLPDVVRYMLFSH